jgi:diguanylate cyclase (GGDEF)-like protein
MSVLSFLKRQGAFFWGCAGIALVIGLGIVDFLTGRGFAFSIFYLLPVSLAAWYGNRRLGLAIAGASALICFAADFVSGAFHANAALYLWNALVPLGFFLVVSGLLEALKRALWTSRRLSESDYVTGAANSRRFSELIQLEMERSGRTRKPLSLAYFDLDNFKELNDRLGHAAGDKVLRGIASSIKLAIRSLDTVARLGGDEFALLLPETGAVGARAAITRIQDVLARKAREHDWPVTFSIGVVTYNQVPSSGEEMIRLADDAMYAVKAGGKNGILYRVHPE